MPTAPKRPCLYPGCPTLVDSGTCPEHTKQRGADRRKVEGSAWSQGYDSDWEKVRKRALERDHYICQHCLQRDGRYVPAEQVDHKVPFGGKSDPLRLDLNNLQSLCVPCHSLKTANEDGGFGRANKEQHGR